MMSHPAGHAAPATASVTSTRRLRRVADTSRKRSVQSCDFCRKCVPQPAGDGCLMCHTQGVACSYTLPRKARFYGSVEDLSDRFKCLEAIVRGAFPSDPIATVPELLRLGHRLGVTMPDLADDARAKLSLDDLVNTPSKSVTSDQTTAVEGAVDGGGSGGGGGDRRPSMTNAPTQSDAGHVNARPLATEPESADTVNTDNTHNTGNSGNTDNTRHTTTTDGTASSNPQDESSEAIGLVRDTTGQEHFIGSSGSLQFLGQLRRLLLLSQHDNMSRNSSYHGIGYPSSGYSAPGRASQRLSTTFTEEDAAQALEADNSHDGSDAPPTLHHHTPLMDDRPSPMSSSSALARECATIQPEDVNGIMAQLPPRHVLDGLIRVYFKSVHPDFPLFHRGTFEEEYERYIPDFESFYHPRRRTDTPTAEPGWLGCLHMILAFASLVTPAVSSSASQHRPPPSTATPSTAASSRQTHDDVDLAALRKHCVSLTRFRLLPRFISRCTLANIRALLLLALYLHNHNERNAAWNLVGTATRAAFAMGLHRCTVGAEHLRPVEREVRRRVFCTLFGLEQFLASSLGRPSGLSGLSALSSANDANEVEVVPPRAEILDGGGSADADDDDGAMATLLLRLQTILAGARVSAAVKTVGLGSRRLRQEQSAREILQRLDEWRTAVAGCRCLDIPQITETTDSGRDAFVAEAPPSTSTPSMDLDSLKNMLAWQSRPRLRAALVLHMQYRYVAVLSTRSALLYSMAARAARTAPVAHDGGPAPSPSPATSAAPPTLADLCVQNAVQLCRLVLLADSFGLINGVSAMDVFYAYCAAMVLILRSLNGGSEQDQGAVSVSAADAAYCAELRRLIARTRQVLMRVDKCSTMKRFSRVVATFEEGSRRVGRDDVHQNSNTANTANTAGDGTVPAHPSSTTAHPRHPPPSPYAPPAPRQRQTPAHGPAAVHTPSQAPPSVTRRLASMSSQSSALHVDESQRLHMSPSQTSQTTQTTLPPQNQAHFASAGVGALCSNGYDQYGHAQSHLHPHSSFPPWPGQPMGPQPGLTSLFDGEPEENQWVMDTFLGMGMGMGMHPGSGGSVEGDIDGVFSAGMLDWPDMDAIMRNG
ncbi:uncharacterized protein SPSK_04861 [Sporothrix schenckii 1099-18]|uniref:Xylanolytic transcriptional activator regulatory domain-containing protein n=1 Tax=Sporothrix schenckii 1099-18 TaxID=1397361 RepID=A0A0F2LS47_SPOSC|nr:uncharacterized protein SPSK_04861 [Sporothrix schenckii 1099-18]KJR80343.1 hypothetical protein SPSK_04861 [Sporothrix schenckii 1099-18]